MNSLAEGNKYTFSKGLVELLRKDVFSNFSFSVGGPFGLFSIQVVSEGLKELFELFRGWEES